MKLLFYLAISFTIISCSSNKTVYWCGNHPCIDKNEKEAYFKKTMIVEVKDFGKKNLKENSEIEKILQQDQSGKKGEIKEEKVLAKQSKLEKKRRINEEKVLAKQSKLEKKRRINEEKVLAKQAKLEKKRRINEEKVLAKQAKLEKKRRINEEKVLAKKIEQNEKKIIKKDKKKSKKSINVNTDLENIAIVSTNFQKKVKEISKRNIFKPYPDINDIPN